MATVFDAVTSQSTGFGASPQTLLTHTPVSSAPSAVYLGVEYHGAVDITIDGVTYGGVAMTKVGTKKHATSFAAMVDIWRLISPPSGAKDVVVTFSGGDARLLGGVVTVTGSHLTAPDGTFASSSGTADSNPRRVTVAGAADDLFFVLIGISSAGASPSAQSPLTERWSVASTVRSNGATAPGATSLDADWNMSGAWDWAAAGVAIKSEPPPIVLEGSAALALGAAADLTVANPLSGDAGMSLDASATLLAPPLTVNVTMALAAVADLTVANPLSGDAGMSLDASATLLAPPLTVNVTMALAAVAELNLNERLRHSSDVVRVLNERIPHSTSVVETRRSFKLRHSSSVLHLIGSLHMRCNVYEQALSDTFGSDIQRPYASAEKV